MHGRQVPKTDMTVCYSQSSYHNVVMWGSATRPLSVHHEFHLPQLAAQPLIPDALLFFQNILSEDRPKIKI